MTKATTTTNRKQRPGAFMAREAVVGISSVLMALAVGFGLAFQAQVSAIVATAAGLGVWALLLLIHLQVRRSAAVAGIDDELAHLRAEVDRLSSAPGGPVTPPQRVKMALRAQSDAGPQAPARTAAAVPAGGDISEAISQAMAHKRASESRAAAPAAGLTGASAQANSSPPPATPARAAAPVPPGPPLGPPPSPPSGLSSGPASAPNPAARPPQAPVAAAAPANPSVPPHRPALGAVRPRRSAAAVVKTDSRAARPATPPPPPAAQQTSGPDLTWREWQEILNRDAAAPAQGKPAPQAGRVQPPPPPVKAPPAPAPAAAARAAPNPFAFRPAAPPSLKAPAQAGAPPPNVDQSVDQIQDLIRRLAIDINGPLAATEGGPAGPPPPPFAAQAEAEAAVTRSAEALDVTAGAMRASLAAKDARAMGLMSQTAQAAASDDACDFGGDPLAASLAEAITAERFDVFIEPIHALPDRKPRHFEVSVRLRTGDGASLEKADVAGVLRRCGLMPGLDAANMLRAAMVAQWLNTRGRDASVLSAVAGQSLDDAAFLDRAAQAIVRGGRTNLVLAFAQSDVRLFAPGHHHALAMLANIGFRFALEEVTDLGMDFSGLVTAGFSFVKLDASVFLEGLATADGFVPAADICRYLADHGLTLIVGHIEDERQLAKVLGFGVLFGKGRLFGGPKPVKAEVLGQPGVVAA